MSEYYYIARNGKIFFGWSFLIPKTRIDLFPFSKKVSIPAVSFSKPFMSFHKRNPMDGNRNYCQSTKLLILKSVNIVNFKKLPLSAVQTLMIMIVLKREPFMFARFFNLYLIKLFSSLPRTLFMMIVTTIMKKYKTKK